MYQHLLQGMVRTWYNCTENTAVHLGHPRHKTVNQRASCERAEDRSNKRRQIRSPNSNHGETVWRRREDLRESERDADEPRDTRGEQQRRPHDSRRGQNVERPDGGIPE